MNTLSEELFVLLDLKSTNYLEEMNTKDLSDIQVKEISYQDFNRLVGEEYSDTIFDLDATLGGDWEQYIVNPTGLAGSGEFPFLVSTLFYFPDIFSDVFVANGVNIPFLTSEIPVIYGNNNQTTSVIANEFFFYFGQNGLREQEADDPSLFLTVAEPFLAGVRTYSNLAGIDRGVSNCQKKVTWERKLERSQIEVTARAGCSIYSGVIGGRTNLNEREAWGPIFELALINDDLEIVLLGRFVPGGYFDYFNFRDLLEQIVVNEKAILESQLSPDLCSAMTVQEEIDIYFQLPDDWADLWLSNLPCVR